MNISFAAFTDDFNRANNATIGNGWLENGSISIASNRTQNDGSREDRAAIYRNDTFTYPIILCANFTPTRASGNTPNRFDWPNLGIKVTDPGETFEGYGYYFARSSSSYSNSGIYLYDDTSQINSWTSLPFQFDSWLYACVQFNSDGSTNFTVSSTGGSYSNSRSSRSVSSSGDYIRFSTGSMGYTDKPTIDDVYISSVSTGGNEVTGDEDDVTTTGVTDLAIEIDGTPLNETGTLTGTQNLTFKDQGKTLVIVSHDFDSSGVDISSWTLTVDTGFVGIDDNNEVVGTKTIYVDKLANVDSLCVKDAAGVTSADDISDACDQANEYNFTACIGGSYSNGGGISCTDDSTKFIISGLQHSGAEQQGSENVPEFGLIGYLLATLGSYFGIKFRGVRK